MRKLTFDEWRLFNRHELLSMSEKEFSDIFFSKKEGIVTYVQTYEYYLKVYYEKYASKLEKAMS